ncbi:hypothetical protein BH24ACT3_BH24ACT3_19680 [soil metagenome]
MITRSRRRWIGLALAAALLVGACSDDGEAGGDVAPAGGEAAEDGLLEVPGEFETIQAAVDAASSGDLVLISPGTYTEAVSVAVDEIVIRGLDRDETILEGDFELESGIRVVGADGVAIENITAQNYNNNGFLWTGAPSFRGAYLTAVRNGDYGIYAFESTDGLWEQSFASGSPDAGFYVGACYPCNVVIDDVVAEWNGLGYSGTNAGGDLYLVNSVWRDNRAGILPNVGTYEPCYPQREATIVGNLVHDNNNGENDVIDFAQLALGNGILLAGGFDNVVERNRVSDHDITGIATVPLPEDNPRVVSEEDIGECESDRLPAGLLGVTEAELPSPLLWPSQGNRIAGNVVEESGLADLALADLGLSPTPEGGNCFSDNTVTSTAPFDLQAKAPCQGEPAATGFEDGALDVGQLIARDKPAPVPYQEAELPDHTGQPQMPDPDTAPAEPQVGPPSFPDLATIEVPPSP